VASVVNDHDPKEAQTPFSRLHVLEPGLCTLVVDMGRRHYRSRGVPVGGAADRAALALGNALVGNPPEAAALEICLSGPTLQADGQLACVVYGAPFATTLIKSGFSDPPDFREIAPGHSFTLDAGDQLHIGSAPAGMRGYFCVQGGLQVPSVLESRSGLEPLQGGAELTCPSGRIHARSLPTFISPGQGNSSRLGGRTRISEALAVDWSVPPESPRPLRVIEGLQASWFDQGQFYNQHFTVTPASNRMGLRLQGRPLAVPKRELVSEPVCPGAVQVTSDGQSIVLGVDGQTIGGYPKIAQVIQADLDRLGQLRPGQRVRFVPCGLDEALEAHRRRQAELNHWVLRVRAALAGF
jgi:antagonist of KipI